jgi:hypothetical protein
VSLSIAQIEKLIRDAFHCALPLNSLPLSFEEMNGEIARFNSQDARKYLPLLLIKELENPERTPDSNGDLLVYFLDGYLQGRSRYAASRAVLEQIKTRTFADFTALEAQAILTWLEEVAYPKYSRLCAADLDSAIKYWKDRVSSRV